MNSNNQEEENMPQTFYINSKLHSKTDNSKALKQNQTTRTNEHTSKPTKRAPSKSLNKKPINTTTQPNAQNEQEYHYHSSK
jgi:hypothetical protein